METSVPAPCLRQYDTEDDLLRDYWRRGYQYNEISLFLAQYHNVHLNERQLRYRFRLLGLSRRNNTDPDAAVREAIQQELQGPNRTAGYRRMWRCLLRDYNLNVRRCTVQRILQEEDPEGSAQRRTRRLTRRRYFSLGPNMTWHVDGNDKLKAYGICIHGCLDGYSRRCLWLRVCPTNKDAKTIATFYLDAISELGGCPLIVRSDPGTENVVIAAMQSTFRANADDDYAGTRSHQYGRSVHNQRIEQFWSHLKPRLKWWAAIFQGLVDEGDFEVGNHIHTGCLRFCFMALVAQDISLFAEDWNDRRVMPRHGASVPPGRPNVLYFLPEQTGGQDLLQAVPARMQQSARRHCRPVSVGDVRLHRYLREMLRRLGRQHPRNTDEALALYRELAEIATE